MLKKLMLLAMAVGALVAFSASAAQADEWYTHVEGQDVTVGLGPENAHEAEFTGELSSTALGGIVKSGDCEVHALVNVWNEESEDGSVTGTGEVTNFTITTNPPCPVTSSNPEIVPLPEGCVIEKATSEDFPWHVSVLPETGIAIGDENKPANFTNFYSGCTPPLPPSATAEGVATGTAVNGEGEVCIVFANAGDLSGALGPVTIDGEVCAPNLTLK